MSDNDVDPGMAEDWAAATAEIDTAEGGDEEVVETSEESVDETADTSEETSEEGAEDIDPELADARAEGEDDEEGEAADPAAELETFKKMAEKLGFAVNDKGVTKRDLAAFADKKRRTFNKLNQDRQELNRQWEYAKSQLEEEKRPLASFLQALESQDLDGLAKIAGFQDWNDLQGVQLKRMNDPSYHEIQKLKQEREAERAAREKAEAEHKARLEAENRNRGIQNYKLNLSKTAAASKDPLAKVMHDDRMFVETVYSVQRDLIDPMTGKTVSIEEALDVELPNGKTLRQNLKAHYEKLSSVFGGKTSAPAVKDNPAGMKTAKVKGGEAKPVVKTATKTVVKKAPKKSESEELLDEMNMFARKMQAETKKGR
jgi:hypothetical protein